jgi:rod shape-determining protein MreD
VKAAAVLGALALSLLMQTTLAGLSYEAGTLVNVVLIAVVYVALALGPVAGLLTGATGGLVQDAIAGGIVGLGGMSKTLVGFIVGVLGAQFIVSQPLPRFVMFVAATVVHELSFQSLYALVEGHGLRIVWPTLLTQASVNAVIGVIAFAIVEQMPGVVARRNARRGTSLSRRRF